MRPSDNDPDAFYSAHELALNSVPEDQREEKFVRKLALFLVHELARARVQTVLEDQSRATEKIQKALTEIQEKHGIDFIIDHRRALLTAFEHTLSKHLDTKDLPPGIRESGLFKLDLPDGFLDKK